MFLSGLKGHYLPSTTFGELIDLDLKALEPNGIVISRLR
jgi:hypothetical protein